MRKIFLVILMAVLAVSTAASAWAEGFALYEWSARGLALGGATVARKRADPSAVASNPALITKLKGAHVMGGVTSLSPRGSMGSYDRSGEHKTTNLKVNTWVMPHLYYTQQLTDSLFFGIGEFTRFGLGFEYPHDWPGRFNIYSVSLKTASINPNIAWAVTDDFSIAAGLEIMYLSLDLNKRAFIDNKTIPMLPAGAFLEVDSDITDAASVSFGYNFALHWDATDEWSFGLTYRSPVKHRAEGENEFSLVDTNLPPANADAVYNRGFRDSDAHGTVKLPESIHAAVAWQPREDLSFEVGAIWTRWSRFEHLTIYLDDPQNTHTKSHKYWKNSWRFNFGVEYDALDWLTVRGGYVFDQSPMTSKHADYLVPTHHRHIYSLGLGAHWDSWTVDLGYAYIYALGRDYGRNDGTGLLNSKSDGHTNIFSLSVGYEF